MFIIQRRIQGTEDVWEDTKAGGDTPRKAIDALERAGAEGDYRVVVPAVDNGTSVLDIIPFKIEEIRIWKATVAVSGLCRTENSPTSEPHSDCG